MLAMKLKQPPFLRIAVLLVLITGSGCGLLGSATDGVLARYGLRSEVTIGRAVAGDW